MISYHGRVTPHNLFNIGPDRPGVKVAAYSPPDFIPRVHPKMVSFVLWRCSRLQLILGAARYARGHQSAAVC